MESTPTIRRSWLRPRYSLRVLLLAFTAFAIGFPVWYRWPYEEIEDLADGAPIRAWRITTWQRQWGGERLRHGPERVEFPGQLQIVTTYANGRKNGLYWMRGMVVNPAFESGQYADDEKEGVWTELDRDEKIVTTWHHGKQVSPSLTPPP
jgi:hypothetical protein